MLLILRLIRFHGVFRSVELLNYLLMDTIDEAEGVCRVKVVLPKIENTLVMYPFKLLFLELLALGFVDEVA